ncbi:MAG: DUF1684 domain-containing protein, partial [Bacteroidota bacterium]
PPALPPSRPPDLPTSRPPDLPTSRPPDLPTSRLAMRLAHILVPCLLLVAACRSAPPETLPLPPLSERTEQWQAWRAAKDSLFRSPESPLLPAQQAGFETLDFFPYDPALAFAVTLAPALERDTLRMATSTGEPRDYIRFGTFSLPVGARRYQITAFQAIETDLDRGQPLRLFIPFMDATSGRSTYAAGRYLDLDPTADGRYVLDFNYAYNPYCVYNPAYSCPLPPPENRLALPVPAGEQSFDPS